MEKHRNFDGTWKTDRLEHVAYSECRIHWCELCLKSIKKFHLKWAHCQCDDIFCDAFFFYSLVLDSTFPTCFHFIFYFSTFGSRSLNVIPCNFCLGCCCASLLQRDLARDAKLSLLLMFTIKSCCMDRGAWTSVLSMPAIPIHSYIHKQNSIHMHMTHFTKLEVWLINEKLGK